MGHPLIESHKTFLEDYIKFGIGGELRTRLVGKDKSTLVTDLRCYSTDILSRTSIIKQNETSKIAITKHGYVSLRPTTNFFMFIYNHIVFEVTVDPCFFKHMQPEDLVDSRILNWEFITRLDIILDAIVSKYHERYDNHCIKQWEFY